MNARIIVLGVGALAVMAGSALLVSRLATKPAATIVTTILNEFCMGAVNGNATVDTLEAMGFTPLETGTDPRAATAEGGWVEMVRFPGEPQSHGCLMRLSPDQKSGDILPLLVAFAGRHKMDPEPVAAVAQGDTATGFAGAHPLGILRLIYTTHPDVPDSNDPLNGAATLTLYVDTAAMRGR